MEGDVFCMGSQIKGLVSVIMPTYNRADIIGKAIASVIKQSYVCWELLIIDDGSTDYTKLAVEEFQDSRVKYFTYGVNHGGNYARNYGMAKAQGEYIAFLDSDNEWDKFFLIEHIRAIEKIHADVVFCRYGVMPYQSNQFIYVPGIDDYDLEPKAQLLDHVRLCKDMLLKNRFDTNTVCFRYSLYSELGGFDENLKRLQDWEYFLRLTLAKCYRIVFLSKVMAWGKVRTDSATHRHSHFQANFYIYKKYLDAFQLYGMAEEGIRSMVRINNGNEMVVKKIQQELFGLLPDAVVKMAVKKEMCVMRLEQMSKSQGDERRDDTSGLTTIEGEKYGMLIYGANRHLQDMVMWFPDFMRHVDCVYAREENGILPHVKGLESKIVSADLLKNLQSGTQIVISDTDDEAYRRAEKYIEGINPGLECLNLDEECGSYCVQKVVGSPVARSVPTEGETSFYVDAARFLSEHDGLRRIFWGGEVWKPEHRRSLHPWLRDGDAFLSDDSKKKGSLLDGHPVLSSSVLSNLRGEMIIVVLGDYSVARRQIIALGLQENKDFIDGNGLLVLERERQPEFKPASIMVSQLQKYRRLKIPYTDEPVVSIVIPAHNNWDYTYNCLCSIIKNTKDVPYEVILGDDASTDASIYALTIVDNLRITRNHRAMGFLMNCNRAAKLARGKYIHFLNNDTLVKPGWLSSLVELMETHPDIGMTGSKLVYSDGRLQEAGGIIWSDGRGGNYGRLQDPTDEAYNYVKEVDYITGASILIRADLWKSIGGFDTRYIPVYCEDADLAFEVRKAGYKVVFQPRSVVIHFEGITNGKDTRSGQKAYQIDNGIKFREKWQDVLVKHCSYGQQRFLARDRSWKRKTVLILDMFIPEWDTNAGARTTYQYLRLFQSIGLHVVLIGARFDEPEPYTTCYRQMGVEVLAGKGWSFERFAQWLDMNGMYIDYAYLQRTDTTFKFLELFKKTRAKLFFYPMDLGSVRLTRQAQVTGRQEFKRKADEMRKKEDVIFPQMDIIHVVGSLEQQIVQERYPGKVVRNIAPFLYEENYFKKERPQIDGREGLIFVGGFDHSPNVDAVHWFVEKIYPLIQRKNPHFSVYIVGSHPREDVLELASKKVIVTGYVDDQELERLYGQARVAIVPLRYGAGLKGKIIESMAFQVPVVTTAIGAEGYMGIEKYIDIADSEQDFANSVLKYLHNDNYWQTKANRLLEYVKEHCSIMSAEKMLREDLEL